MDRPHASNLGTPLAVEMTGLTAWEACRRLSDLPHLLFLDSAVKSPQGRYSYVAADPREWLQWTDESGDPFAAVRGLLNRGRHDTIPELPPFQGGVAGLFGYELSRRLERLPRPIFNDFALPDLAVGLYDWVLSFDNVTGRAWLIAAGPPDERQNRADQVRRWLDRGPISFVQPSSARVPLNAPRFPVPDRSPLTSNFDRSGYEAVLRRAIDYIHAGDCFQVNIAQQLVHPVDAPALEIHHRLRTRNAAPFAGYLDLGEYAIASASPERFLRLTDGEVETRPIKGTRPRGYNPMEDMARGGDLLDSLKDRAENVMIVDLLRNDLGRVCEFGSIQVSVVCQLETFRFVHHLVSEVRGRLRPGLDGLDLLRAAFPGGSVTGAPKIRAMEIITELERSTRGPYCGCLGFLGFDGAMDTNLLIRTFAIGGGWISFSVGGGIVADSDPAREYEETWHKAAGMARALEP